MSWTDGDAIDADVNAARFHEACAARILDEAPGRPLVRLFAVTEELLEAERCWLSAFFWLMGWK